MKLSPHIRRFKHGLAYTTALCCLISSSLPLQAQLGVSTVDSEKGLAKALGNETINTIRLKKGSRILLTKELPVPKSFLGLDGQIDGAGNRPIIDGRERYSIRLDGDNPDLDFIRNIGFENGRGAEPDGEGEEGKNNFGGGAFYIPGDIQNGIENSHFISNKTNQKSGGAIYVAGDFLGGVNKGHFRKNEAEWGGGFYVLGNFEGGIIGSNFEDNAVGQGGGAVYVKGALVGGIVESSFKKNIAYQQFGAAVYAGSLEGGIIKSQFTDNKSGWSGAAIFVDNSFSGGISQSVFLRNEITASSGGAIGVTTKFEGDIEASLFEKNSASNQGGAIHVYEDFSGDIVGSIFKTNRAGQDGGAISIVDRLQGGIYEGSLFEDNKASRQGGAIYVGSIEGDIADSRFIGNEAGEEGGAIFLDEILIGNISGSVFEDNTALDGGAIYINDGKLDGAIEDSEFTNNSAVNNGGALNVFNLEEGIASSDFNNNEAGNDGGAIYILNTLKGGIGGDSSFSENVAEGSGGAAYISDLRGGIENAYFLSNDAGAFGGALYVDTLGGGINSVTFENNSATSGGAIYASTLKGGISNSLFENNDARESGGALYIRDMLKGNIRSSHFVGNSAADGGAIYAGDQIKGNIGNSVFRDNYADYLGGAIFVKELDGGIKKSLFTNNATAGWGGAIYMGGIFEGGISNSIFVKNQASFDPDRDQIGQDADPMGLGGAIFSYGEGSGNRIITNSIFLANAARARNKVDSYGGLGGAIFHNATLDDGAASILTIEATAGKRAIFYGNRSRRANETQDRANAIYLGNMGQDDRKTQVNIKADEDATIFMFDPLESQGDGVVDGTGEHYGKLEIDLHKTGKGAWFLGGNSVMHGTASWNIDEGSLNLTKVDGVEASINLEHQREAKFHLGAMAKITGSGTITARDITLSGTLDPSSLQKIGMGVDAISDETNIALGVDQSSRYGTITLESRDGGAVSLKDATYVVDIGDEENDLIRVKGDVMIEGGTIDVRSHVSIKDEASGLYKEDSHVILANDGNRQGQFEHVRDDLAFWNARLDYVDHRILLRFVRDLDGATKGCASANQCHIGEAVKKLGDDHKIIEAIIDMNKQELGNAYDNLSGEIYVSGRSALLGEDHLYRNLAQRMVQRHQNPDSNLKTSSQSSLSPMWFSTFTHSGYYTGNNYAARLNTTGNGVAIGLDRAENQGLLGGFLLGHETIRLSNGGARNSHTNINSYSFGTYLAGEVADLHLSAGVLYHILDFQTERDIWVKGKKTSLAGTAKADYYGHKVQIFAEAAKDIDISSSLILSPYLQLSHNYLHTAKAQESSNTAMLDIAGDTDNLFSSTIGLRGFYDLPTLMPVRLNGDFGWQHHFGTGQTTGQHNFHLSNDVFDIKGIALERDSIFVSTGLNAILNEAVSLNIGYQGQFGHGVSDHSGMMQIKVQF